MKRIFAVIIFCLFFAFPPAGPAQAASLGEKLKGYFLLQVQSPGKVWYVNPLDGKRYYIKDVIYATELFKQYGLGITNADLKKIPVGSGEIAKNFTYIVDSDKDGLNDKLEAQLGTNKAKADTDADGTSDWEELKKLADPLVAGRGRLQFDQKLANRLKGRILLQVQDKGQVWYVNPKDGKRYFLPDAAAGLNLLGHLALGITDANLNLIAKKDLYIPPEKISYWGLTEALKNPAKVYLLHLTDQNYEELPAAVMQFKNLTELYLAANYLKTVPKEIGSLTKLRILDLGWNRLESLPAEIGQLTKLEHLELAGNRGLASLPDSILNLRELNYLSLTDTSIEKLPEGVKNLPKLKILHFNPPQPIDVCQLPMLGGDKQRLVGKIYTCQDADFYKVVVTEPGENIPYFFLSQSGKVICLNGGQAPAGSASSVNCALVDHAVCSAYLCNIRE